MIFSTSTCQLRARPLRDGPAEHLEHLECGMQPFPPDSDEPGADPAEKAAAEIVEGIGYAPERGHKGTRTPKRRPKRLQARQRVRLPPVPPGPVRSVRDWRCRSRRVPRRSHRALRACRVARWAGTSTASAGGWAARASRAPTSVMTRRSMWPRRSRAAQRTRWWTVWTPRSTIRAADDDSSSSGTTSTAARACTSTMPTRAARGGTATRS